MRRRYHDLIGTQVIAADGRRLGRVIDLVAERRGEALCVTALLVGHTGLARRVGFKRISLAPLPPPRAIPWRLVARTTGAVHLLASAAEVDALSEAREEAMNRADVDDASTDTPHPGPETRGDSRGRTA